MDTGHSALSSHRSDSLPESIGKRVDPIYAKTLTAKTKELLRIQHEGFPGSQPVSFESKHLNDLEREDYFVCEKSDGIRFLLFFHHSPKGPASFMYDRNRMWFYVPNLVFPMRGRDKEFLKDTLMDGELVEQTDDNNNKSWRFLIFDLMALNNVSVIQRAFNTRLGMLRQDVLEPFNASLKGIDQTKLPPFSLGLKKMERAYGLHLVFEQISKLQHHNDGVVWTPVKYPYVPGTCEKLLKWKPSELNTVDFRVSARWSKEHKPIYTLQVLSQGTSYKFYDHFQPDPTIAKEWKRNLPDGRIGEFRFDPQLDVTIVEPGYAPTTRKGGWCFVRFRDDKETANDEIVVQKIMKSIQDGVTKEQLLSHMDRVRSAWKARERGLPPPRYPKFDSTTAPSSVMSAPPATSPVLKASSSNTSHESKASDGSPSTPTRSRLEGDIPKPRSFSLDPSIRRESLGVLRIPSKEDGDQPFNTTSDDMKRTRDSLSDTQQERSSVMVQDKPDQNPPSQSPSQPPSQAPIYASPSQPPLPSPLQSSSQSPTQLSAQPPSQQPSSQPTSFAEEGPKKRADMVRKAPGTLARTTRRRRVSMTEPSTAHPSATTSLPTANPTAAYPPARAAADERRASMAKPSQSASSIHRLLTSPVEPIQRVDRGPSSRELGKPDHPRSHGPPPAQFIHYHVHQEPAIVRSESHPGQLRTWTPPPHPEVGGRTMGVWKVKTTDPAWPEPNEGGSDVMMRRATYAGEPMMPSTPIHRPSLAGSPTSLAPVPHPAPPPALHASAPPLHPPPLASAYASSPRPPDHDRTDTSTRRPKRSSKAMLDFILN